MAIFIKSEKEITGIRKAGRIVAKTLKLIESEITEGRTLEELEKLCVKFITAENAKPAFLGYRGFPGAVCISVNDEVVHGIPNGRRLLNGEIVKIDVGVYKDGLYADGAKSFRVGKINQRLENLMAVAARALDIGVNQARAFNHVSDISWAIQNYVEEHGFSVIRELSGHGVGLQLHEEPSIPNFGKPGKGVKLVPGMTLAIEPMVNLGSYEVWTEKNGWTVRTKDGKPSAHFEHTVLVTESEPEILTRID
ncbi:MAG: type I methionyl aminopeptidase [candidate division WOR-3 bacterium]|nr:type I methionyl aminopeptidase [candidate division WOR-3 bacterium]